MGNPGQQAKGFTLIEILVAVTTIALLISIALPSLRRAREQVRRTQCSINQRTCHQAVVSYCQMSKDYFPYVKQPVGNSLFLCQSWEVLYTYMQTGLPGKFKDAGKICRHTPPNPLLCVDYYLCPSDKIHHTTWQAEQTLSDGTVMEGVFVLSFSANTLVLGRHKSTSIKNHSRYVIFAESGDDTEHGMEAWDLDDFNRDDNESGFDMRHLGGCNVMYLDGHSEFSRMTSDLPHRGLPPFPYAWRPKYDLNDPDIAAWLQRGRRVYATLKERWRGRWGL